MYETLNNKGIIFMTMLFIIIVVTSHKMFFDLNWFLNQISIMLFAFLLGALAQSNSSN